MAKGGDTHLRSESVIAKAAANSGHPARVTSSAGALMRTLQDLGARKVAMVALYMQPLTTWSVTKWRVR